VVEEEQEGKRITASPAEVDHGAGVLFVFVQQTLRWLREHDHGFGFGNERLVIDLWKAQNVAFEAVAARCPGGRRRAKQLQLEAGHGAPLTVCVGDLTPKPLPDRLPRSMTSRLPANVRSLADLLDPEGELELNEEGDPYKVPTISWNTLGSGCKLICPDSTGTRRPGLRRWCQTCGKSSSSRLEAQLTSIQKSFGGSPSHMLWVGGRRVRVWPRRCSSCGRTFKTDRVNQRRCGDCFAAHRGSAPRSHSSAPPSS
jgi:predicted Zn-ribbon and HTH transcriptional regulator